MFLHLYTTKVFKLMRGVGARAALCGSVTYTYVVRCRECESRCAEQVRALQQQAEAERELLLQETSRQRTKLEQEMVTLKEEEVRLREKLSNTLEVQLLPGSFNPRCNTNQAKASTCTTLLAINGRPVTG